jgi:hypothetical protein
VTEHRLSTGRYFTHSIDSVEEVVSFAKRINDARGKEVRLDEHMLYRGLAYDYELLAYHLVALGAPVS